MQSMEAYMGKELKRFNYLAGEIDAVYHKAALKFELSDSAMKILYAICNSGDTCPLSDILLLSGLSKQTANSALRALEKEGIVYLEMLGGKRKLVCLTEKGRELSENSALKIIEIENEIFDSWTKQEREIYIGLTQKYLDAMREKVFSL